LKIKSITTIGAAIHSRATQPGQDYDWYIKLGDMQLFEQIDKIYGLALRDVSGEEWPKMAILVAKQRIGLLLADMPTIRLDHTRRIIYDTLYLEFEPQHWQIIARTTATLLTGSKNASKLHEQHFTEFAERLWQKPQLPNTVKLPDNYHYKASDPNLLPLQLEKVALFANTASKARCAHHLVNFASEQLQQTFCLITTGRLNLEKCRQLATFTEKCILLTASAEITTEVNLKPENQYSWRNLLRLRKA
jgi:hypothetical protein